MTEENVTTHSSAYPNSEPAARLVAQFPGSMKPTVTNSPGPMYFSKSNAPERGRWLIFSLSNRFPISLARYGMPSKRRIAFLPPHVHPVASPSFGVDSAFRVAAKLFQLHRRARALQSRELHVVGNVHEYMLIQIV